MYYNSKQNVNNNYDSLKALVEKTIFSGTFIVFASQCNLCIQPAQPVAC